MEFLALSHTIPEAMRLNRDIASTQLTNSQLIASNLQLSAHLEDVREEEDALVAASQSRYITKNKIKTFTNELAQGMAWMLSQAEKTNTVISIGMWQPDRETSDFVQDIYKLLKFSGFTVNSNAVQDQRYMPGFAQDSSVGMMVANGPTPILAIQLARAFNTIDIHTTLPVTHSSLMGSNQIVVFVIERRPFITLEENPFLYLKKEREKSDAGSQRTIGKAQRLFFARSLNSSLKSVPNNVPKRVSIAVVDANAEAKTFAEEISTILTTNGIGVDKANNSMGLFALHPAYASGLHFIHNFKFPSSQFESAITMSFGSAEIAENLPMEAIALPGISSDLRAESNSLIILVGNKPGVEAGAISATSINPHENHVGKSSASEKVLAFIITCIVILTVIAVIVYAIWE